MMKQTDSSRRRVRRSSGGIPFHILLIVCGALLLAAVAVTGYGWHREHSANARLRQEAIRIEAKRQELENQQKAEALAAEKAEEAFRLALAKNQQEAFAASVRKLTNKLEDLLAEGPALQEKLESLRTGEPGRKVAVYPELVASARVLFQRDATAVPGREEVVQRLEGQRRLLVQLAEHSGTAFEPNAEMIAALDEAEAWTATATAQFDSARRFADGLLQESLVKVPPASNPNPPASLQAAIDKLVAAERQDYIVKEAEVLGDARAEATNDVLIARSKEITDAAKLERQRKEDEARRRQAEQDRESARLAAELAEKALIDEALSPATREVLATFLAKGNWQPKAGFTVEKQPMSYSQLKQVGALNRTVRGLAKLRQIATTGQDKIRPRMSNRTPKHNTDALNTYQEAQELLIKLGPTLVKLEMLAP